MRPREFTSVPMRLAELLVEARLPAGVLNVINGDKEAVDTLLTDPRAKAIGLVGPSAIAEYILHKSRYWIWRLRLPPTSSERY